MNQQTSAILAEFEHFLHEQNTVMPNQRPLYVQWVKRYLSFGDTVEWLPEGVIAQTTERYREAYHRLVGKEL